MSIPPMTQTEQALAELAEQFTHWRQQRAHRHERIPIVIARVNFKSRERLPN